MDQSIIPAWSLLAVVALLGFLFGWGAAVVSVLLTVALPG